MNDLQYPMPTNRKMKRTIKVSTMLMLSLILGFVLGYNIEPPEPLQPIIGYPSNELWENGVSDYSGDRFEVNITRQGWKLGMDMYVHNFNDIVTEYYFDWKLTLVTDQNGTYKLDADPYETDIFRINANGIVYINIWFLERPIQA